MQPRSLSGRAEWNPVSCVPARGWAPAKRSPIAELCARFITAALMLHTSESSVVFSRRGASSAMRSMVGCGGAARITSSAPLTAEAGDSASSVIADALSASTPSLRSGENPTTRRTPAMRACHASDPPIAPSPITAREDGRIWDQPRSAGPRCRRSAKSVLIWHPIRAGVSMARILIVEDSPDNMKLFRTILGLKGHDVTGLAGGDGLLAAIEEKAPELILMDIQLPGKDGFTLLQEIRASVSLHVRVIALTAHAMTGDRERALDAGFDGYITKPIDIRGLPEQVERALRGDRLE